MQQRDSNQAQSISLVPENIFLSCGVTKYKVFKKFYSLDCYLLHAYGHQLILYGKVVVRYRYSSDAVLSHYITESVLSRWNKPFKWRLSRSKAI